MSSEPLPAELGVPTGWRRFARHGISTIDQGVTSVGNFALSIAIASVSSVEVFAQFALLYSLYWLLTGLCRAVIGESALADTSGAGSVGLRSGPLYLALGVGVVGAATGMIWGHALGLPILQFGSLIIPLLVAQDVTRYVAFALQRQPIALASDVLMLAIQFAGGLGGVYLLGLSASASWVAGWGIGALAGLLLASIALGLGRSPSVAVPWIAGHRSLSASVGAEYVLNTGVQQVLNFLIPVVSGLVTLGFLKAAQVAVGPLNVMLTSVSLILLPVLFRVFKEGDLKRLRRIYLLTASATVGVSLVYLVVLLLIPSGWLSVVFGPSWAGAMPAAAIITGQVLLVGISQIGGYVLRAAGKPLRSTILSAWMMPFNLGLPLLGAALQGTTGIAIGLCTCAALGAVAWSITADRTLRAVAP